MDVLKKISSSFSGSSADHTSGASADSSAHAAAHALGEVELPGVDNLPDDELEPLNRWLPWAAFLLDRKGRQFGVTQSATTRNLAQAMPDSRIIELDRRIPLCDLTEFEIGCFEGIRTAALARSSEQ
ncbi:hypothetical protein ATY81_21825 [Rhizobium sp. R72]|uniref:hypothetical protein n=1 Tax=unclassified Rhizobium TaxID=2613769 RepID=UPI000B69F6A0|nr:MULTISPECIES: hypothetical protein [unclassified Rhizobium]OWW02297.1 hypothetical protein ATY81_21825 [Rhizobium sp. R72]OWW02431.1 hypothetical protein ATY80_21825 [Rhizobium sp. R711]